jgi:hypothetical protein
MLAETFKRINGLTTLVAEAQVSTVKAVTNYANLLSWGIFAPLVEVSGACCDFYMENCKRAEAGWLNSFPVIQFVNVVEKMQTASPQTDRPVEYPSGTHTDQYANLREASQNSRRSIIDDDRFWPMSGTGAKSAHKYDAQQRERIRDHEPS